MKSLSNIVFLFFLLGCGALAVCEHLDKRPNEMHDKWFWFIGVVVPTLNIIAWWSILLADKANNRKLIWALIVLFVPILGPILWFCFGNKFS